MNEDNKCKHVMWKGECTKCNYTKNFDASDEETRNSWNRMRSDWRKFRIRRYYYNDRDRINAKNIDRYWANLEQNRFVNRINYWKNRDEF